MTWIAISSPSEAWVSPRRFHDQDMRRDGLLERGSLVLETRLGSRRMPEVILAYDRAYPWSGGLSIQSIPGGGVALVIAQGDEVFHAVIEPDRDERTDVIRITFSWDAPRRWGRLAVERPEYGTVRSVTTSAPPPLMLEDIYTLTRRPQLCRRDGELIWFAFSDTVEPVGPMPSLTSGVPVSTPFGLRRLADLKRGDTVHTRDNGVVPVVHTVERTVPACGSFQPVRLRAPYFGLHHDIVVAPHQRLVIGGSEVEYLFGREAVLIPAISLVNNMAAVFETGQRLVRYRQVLLPGHAALMSVGAALESLYVGRLRRHKDRVGDTLLADCPPNFLPEHHRSVYQVLKPFEALTLAEARAA